MSEYAFEFSRMMFGSTGYLYYIEVLIRTVIIYLYTLFAMRVLAGRSGTQTSLIELLFVIALGSAVGTGMFMPGIPVMHVIAVVTMISLINRLLDTWIIRSRAAKSAVDGEAHTAISDGRILFDTINKRSMGPTELQSMVRAKGVRNLAEVRVAYFEPHGDISIFRVAKPGPGLRIEPPPEIEPFDEVDPQTVEGKIVCTTCGYVIDAPYVGECIECKHDVWTMAE